MLQIGFILLVSIRKHPSMGCLRKENNCAIYCFFIINYYVIDNADTSLYRAGAALMPAFSGTLNYTASYLPGKPA